MKMKGLQKQVILLLLITGHLVASAQDIDYIYVKDIPSTADYTADFEKVSDNVNKRYTHLKDKNIDGDSLQTGYLTLVKNAKDNITYGDILIRYFAALRNSHSSVIFKKYYKNCSATLIEDRVFLSYVGDSLFINNGIKEKDEILKINNVPVSTYLRDQAKYTSASTNIHRKYLTAAYLFSSYSEEDRAYTVKTGTGEKEITMHFTGTPQAINSQTSKPYAKVESKLLNDSVAYIAILSMTGNVVDEFVKAFDTLSGKHFLIIDIRRNQGGNSGYSEKIAEYLITNKQRACVSGRSLSPANSHFKGKLFVLTSPFTFSAAESFALDLLESGNATLVGMPTAGDTGNQPQFYSSKLGYSYWFPSRSKAQISPKGFPMEGQSIQPHYAVSKTIADYFADKDTILEYALRLISND